MIDEFSCFYQQIDMIIFFFFLGILAGCGVSNRIAQFFIWSLQQVLRCLLFSFFSDIEFSS